MADPKIGAQGPATDDLTEDTRTPEEELADIEAKAAKDAAGGTDEDDEGAGTGDADRAVDDEASEAKVRAFMVKKGVNDIGKLVDFFAGLESKNTKLAQEVKRLSAVNRFSAAGLGAVQGGGASQGSAGDEIQLDIPENPIDLVMDKTKLQKYSENLIRIGEERQAKREQARTYSEIHARVQAKMEENPEEFNELKSSMIELSKQYPGADIDQLYEGAKLQRAAQAKSLVAIVKKELGLTDSQTERLKGLSARLRTAPITSGTGVQVKVAESDEEKANKTLLEAIRNADKY